MSRDLNEVTLWDLYQSSPWPLPEGFGQGEGWSRNWTRPERHLSVEPRKARSRPGTHFSWRKDLKRISSSPPSNAFNGLRRPWTLTTPAAMVIVLRTCRAAGSSLITGLRVCPASGNPELAALSDNHADIEVFGVNFDQPDPETMARQIEKLKVTFPVIDHDPYQYFGIEKPEVLPTTLIITPAGELRDAGGPADRIKPAGNHSQLAALHSSLTSARGTSADSPSRRYRYSTILSGRGHRRQSDANSPVQRRQILRRADPFAIIKQHVDTSDREFFIQLCRHGRHCFRLLRIDRNEDRRKAQSPLAR